VNIHAFAFPVEAGTHLPTPEGWKAELALGGWLVTYRNKCSLPGIEPGHGRPSQMKVKVKEARAFRVGKPRRGRRVATVRVCGKKVMLESAHLWHSVVNCGMLKIVFHTVSHYSLLLHGDYITSIIVIVQDTTSGPCIYEYD